MIYSFAANILSYPNIKKWNDANTHNGFVGGKLYTRNFSGNVAQSSEILQFKLAVVIFTVGR